jgi:hypothetical protein
MINNMNYTLQSAICEGLDCSQHNKMINIWGAGYLRLTHAHTHVLLPLQPVFMNICLSSTTAPKMLVSMKTQSKTITYNSCITRCIFSFFYLCLTTFCSMIWSFILQLCYWLAVPFLASFTLTVGSLLPYMWSYHLRGSARHFPPVCLTSQLFP